MIIAVLVSVAGHMVMADTYNLTSSTTHSVFLLSSASTSAGHGSLLGEIQTFISEGSGPLVVLPGLDGGHFPLTLITRHGNTKRPPHKFLVSQTFSFLSSLLNSCPVCAWQSGSVTAAKTVTPFFAC